MILRPHRLPVLARRFDDGVPEFRHAQAAWLDAEYLIVVNPDGTLHRHQKVGDALAELEPVQNRDYIAPVAPRETVAHSIGYWIQSLREIGNPAEMVFEQGLVALRIWF